MIFDQKANVLFGNISCFELSQRTIAFQWGKVCKVGSPEISGVTGKFGLGVQNEAGQRLTEFCKENALVIANTLFQKHNTRLYTWTSTNGQC